MRAQVVRAGQRVALAVGRLLRPCDYPVRSTDWLSLCQMPQALPGPQDWGLALAKVEPSGTHPGVGRGSGLGELWNAYVANDDARAGLALAALMARFAAYLELAAHFDLACTLPRDFRSGPDPAERLYRWPGVEFPLPLRHALLTWRMAAGLDLPRADTGLRIAGEVAGRRVLIVSAEFDGRAVEAAVHELRRQGARRVGVLTLIVTDLERDS